MMWFKGSKGKINQDPVKYAIKDKASILCGLGVVLTLLLGKISSSSLKNLGITNKTKAKIYEAFFPLALILFLNLLS